MLKGTAFYCDYQKKGNLLDNPGFQNKDSFGTYLIWDINYPKRIIAISRLK